LFTAFLAALLTFFSGFGPGTLLTPVFAIFFPVEFTIALKGVVHFLNNIFKLFLPEREYKFGSLHHTCAIADAFIGNKLLKKITLKTIQNFTVAMLILISIALGAGLI
jgi:hypothetical protein